MIIKRINESEFKLHLQPVSLQSEYESNNVASYAYKTILMTTLMYKANWVGPNIDHCRTPSFAQGFIMLRFTQEIDIPWQQVMTIQVYFS